MDLIYDDIELHVDVPVTQVNNQEKDILIDSESMVTVVPDEGYTGLSSVDITPVLQSSIENVVSNGQYVFEADSGYCGLDTCIVNVNVPVVVNYWLLKTVEFDMGLIENTVFVPTPLSSVGGSTSFNISSISNTIFIYLFGKYSYSGSGIRNVSRLSYVFGRNDSGSTQSLSYSLLLGYQPDFYLPYSLNVATYYPAYTHDNASMTLNYLKFNFCKYNSSFSEVGIYQSIRVRRSVDLTSFGYQSGDLICIDSSGIY